VAPEISTVDQRWSGVSLNLAVFIRALRRKLARKLQTLVGTRNQVRTGLRVEETCDSYWPAIVFLATATESAAGKQFNVSLWNRDDDLP
jgi:hypothetical protein